MEVLRVYFPVTGTAIESGEAKETRKWDKFEKFKPFY